MPSLLDIPPEIRFQILELVLCHIRALPPDPATILQERLELHGALYQSWKYGPQHKLFEPNGYATNSHPLLLTSRQLRAETQSALHHLPAKRSYRLDVMLVHEWELWPTWLSVPALWTRLDSVLTTIRICGAKDRSGRSEFCIGDCSGPPIMWCFYSLLERFLFYGPVGERKLGSEHRNMTINSLTLDVVSSPEIDATMTEPAPTYSEWYRSREGNEDNDSASKIIMRADWLVNFLRDWIGSLLCMSYHTARWGKILYERIGTVRLCADGVLMKEINLAQRLADLRHNDASETFGNIRPRENRVAHFWQWKTKTLVKRRKAGLPVIDPEDSELVGL